MKALVLAAGYGKRLRPITDTITNTVEIGGRPLIHYPLRLLRTLVFATSRLICTISERKVKRRLAVAGRSLAIKYSPEPTLLGTGGILVVLRNYYGVTRF